MGSAGRVLKNLFVMQQPHFLQHEELVLGRRLGAGTFGEVYQATWRGTTVAVKRLLVNVVNAELKAAFIHEASVLFQIRHPRVVLLMGYTNPEASQAAPCLIFEFMEGGTLFTALHEEKRPVDERQIAIDVAEGLGFLHSSKPAILHRDLKSLNILLDRDGKHAKLCDLGLARVKVSSQSLARSQVGTPLWMAPEVMNDEPYGSPADVYSFGLVLYELGSKEIPFKDKTPVQLVRLVVDQLPLLHRLNGDLSSNLVGNSNQLGVRS